MCLELTSRLDADSELDSGFEVVCYLGVLRPCSSFCFLVFNCWFNWRFDINLRLDFFFGSRTVSKKIIISFSIFRRIVTFTSVVLLPLSHFDGKECNFSCYKLLFLYIIPLIWNFCLLSPLWAFGEKKLKEAPFLIVSRWFQGSLFDNGLPVLHLSSSYVIPLSGNVIFSTALVPATGSSTGSSVMVWFMLFDIDLNQVLYWKKNPD